MSNGVGDVLDAHTRGGQDRNERMPLFPGRPAFPDTGAVAQDDEVLPYILRPPRGVSVIAEYDSEGQQGVLARAALAVAAVSAEVPVTVLVGDAGSRT